MPSDYRRDDLLTALELTEFSVHYEDVDPELANRACSWPPIASSITMSSRKTSPRNSRLGSDATVV